MKLITVILALAFLAPAAGDTLSGVDLDRETVYVRRGFDASWIRNAPVPGDRNWLAVPGIRTGTRSIVLKDLPFEGMPERRFFSLTKHRPENFTFVAPFTMDAGALEVNTLRGVYFENIGENWEIYLNGKLLKSEVHLDGNGRITDYRHWRGVLVPIDPRVFREGGNVLAVRIIADPTNIDSGFHRSTPFVIGDLDTLRQLRSDRASLMFIFLYLFVGVYHLFVYGKKRTERHNLFYGAFSVMLFVYLMSRTYSVYSLIQDSTVLHRIEYCSLYTLVPLFGAFADLLLTGRFCMMTKAYAALCAILAAVTALPVPNPFAIDLLRVWQVTMIVPLAYYSIIRIGGPAAGYFREIFNHHKDRPFRVSVLTASWRALTGSTAGNLMLGAIILVACAVFDVLDSMFWSYNYVLSTYGFFAFTLGIALILANRFIGIHTTLEYTNDTIRYEMEVAAYIQRSLLPREPELDDWDIALEYRPLYGPSGDFYDFYTKGRRLDGLAIFDVSGHGISSALVSMIVKPITYRAFSLAGKAGLEQVIDRVDERLAAEFPESENIISCALLRMRGERVEYVNAGHPALLHRRAATGTTGIIDNGGRRYRSAPLGAHVSDELPVVLKFSVSRGDILLLYTDCLIESVNASGEGFGMERLMAALDETPSSSARELLDHVLRSFLSFIDVKRIRDDLSVIVARRK